MSMGLKFDHKIAIAISVAVIIIIGVAWMYVNSPIEVTDADRAVYLCIFLCKASANEGLSMDDGPCLSSGSPAWEVENWVCDVAHWPREDVDNLPVNQCPEYGSTAHHFVEVNPGCGFIRSI